MNSRKLSVSPPDSTRMRRTNACSYSTRARGQNAVNQAVEFNQAIGLTGITMTKLDGGGKGGVLLSIAEQLDVPFRYIGIGEDINDLGVFDADEYAAALVEPAHSPDDNAAKTTIPPGQ